MADTRRSRSSIVGALAIVLWAVAQTSLCSADSTTTTEFDISFTIPTFPTFPLPTLPPLPQLSLPPLESITVPIFDLPPLPKPTEPLPSLPSFSLPDVSSLSIPADTFTAAKLFNPADLTIPGLTVPKLSLPFPELTGLPRRIGAGAQAEPRN